MMIIRAIMMVVMRSIRARWLVSLWWEASFSLMTTRKPETESMKLWMASEVMAMEPETRPTTILNTPRRKLMVIKR